MNLNSVMTRMTLRQMEAADELWRADVGPGGPKFQEAMAALNYRALAALVAAKLRLNGQPDVTIDQALDLELGGDDEGETVGGNGGAPQPLSPVPGS